MGLHGSRGRRARSTKNPTGRYADLLAPRIRPRRLLHSRVEWEFGSEIVYYNKSVPCRLTAIRGAMAGDLPSGGVRAYTPSLVVRLGYEFQSHSNHP